MARTRNDARLENPKGSRSSFNFRTSPSRSDRFGRFTEGIARGMGTPWFIIILTLFVVVWMAYRSADGVLLMPAGKWPPISIGATRPGPASVEFGSVTLIVGFDSTSR